MSLFSKTTTSETFPALTGMRAVAAFMVFFSHLHIEIYPHVLISLQSTFYTGVAFFFVLSGFLIAYRYYDTILLKGKWKRDYLVKRFARIYPVYFLVLTIIIVINKNFNAGFLLQNYTLTHSLFFLFKSKGLAIVPSWSLTVEECFYLLAPFIILLTKRYNLLIPFFISVALYIVFLFAYDDGSPFTEKGFGLSIGSFVGRFFEFYAGIFLAQIVRQKNKRGYKIKSKPATTVLAIILMLVLYIPLMYVLNKSDSYKHATMIVVNNFLLPVAIAIFYYGLIFENTFIHKILASKFFKLLGRSSYAFYLLHVPVIDYIGSAFLKQYFGGHYNLYVVVVFIISLTLSIILFLLYEEPMNKFIRRALDTRQLSIIKTVQANPQKI